eukprot:scaffold834_cov123-Cylindrotheca_fusiformis.AAC.39
MIVNESFIPYRQAAHFLWNLLHDAGIEFPLIGVVCGSGLSELSKALEGKTMSVKYSDIPGFPAHCTVAGHKGEVVFGKLSGIPAICFRGRFHSYEVRNSNQNTIEIVAAQSKPNSPMVLIYRVTT